MQPYYRLTHVCEVYKVATSKVLNLHICVWTPFHGVGQHPPVNHFEGICVIKNVILHFDRIITIQPIIRKFIQRSIFIFGTQHQILKLREIYISWTCIDGSKWPTFLTWCLRIDGNATYSNINPATKRNKPIKNRIVAPPKITRFPIILCFLKSHFFENVSICFRGGRKFCFRYFRPF